MKPVRESRVGTPARTAMKDKSTARETQQNLRPHPSKDTINPNRGLNEDIQKQKTNQEEQHEITNSERDSSTNRNDSADRKDQAKKPASRKPKKINQLLKF